ncbi:MAG TPA: DUF2087 domain-containing protein [Rectinemataceae bacterium]|nr:DUF2087 domain-containing protein [Rectinemataceae bacterium]
MIDESLIETRSSADLSRGYFYDEDAALYRCLRCDAIFEEGRVYPSAGGFSTTERAVKEHAATAHGDLFEELLAMGKEVTGVPDAMAGVLRLLYAGSSDKEIATSLGGKSPSTVRNQRRALRKREAEAKIFLALMGLLDQAGKRVGRFVAYPSSMPMQDDRAIVTEEEAKAIETKYLKENGSLLRIPRKEKEKLVILRRIAERFAPGRLYGQKEVDAILVRADADYAALRRYLIDYRFLEREPDGSAYWVKGQKPLSDGRGRISGGSP